MWNDSRDHRRDSVRLSVVLWGVSLPAQVILVNGGTCEVRQNLYDFLAHIQATAGVSILGLYWIDAIRSKVVLNEYWERVWIIQELFLTRRLQVVLRHEILSLAQLYEGVVFLLSGLDDANFLKFAFLRKGDVQIAKNKSVAELLRDFAGKKCTIPRNQFYSVFDLCEERNDLTVDYSSNKSDLVHHVLQMSRKKVAYAR